MASARTTGINQPLIEISQRRPGKGKLGHPTPHLHPSRVVLDGTTTIKIKTHPITGQNMTS